MEDQMNPQEIITFLGQYDKELLPLAAVTIVVIVVVLYSRIEIKVSREGLNITLRK